MRNLVKSAAIAAAMCLSMASGASALSITPATPGWTTNNNSNLSDSELAAIVGDPVGTNYPVLQRAQ
jgi:hypothetical protein